MPADLTSPGYWDTAILRAGGRFFMLAAFAEAPSHGYDVARTISDWCDGCCSPSDAMIYPAIRDLEAAGLIACEADSTTGRPRNVCTLTAAGQAALREGADAWARHLPALSRLVEKHRADNLVPLDAIHEAKPAKKTRGVRS